MARWTGRRDGPGAFDVPGVQFGQGLVQPAPRGGQDQLDGGPVFPALLPDLGQVAYGQLLTVQGQVIQRPPGSARHVVGDVDLGRRRRGRLDGRGHLGERHRTVGVPFRVLQALLGGFELAAGGAAAGVDLAAAAERGRGVGGQVAGHPGQVVLAGAAEAHRPRQRRGGRLGQVAEEGQPRLLGRVLVVELLDLVAAPVDVRTQLRGLSRAADRSGSGGAPRRPAGPGRRRGRRRGPRPGPRWRAARRSRPGPVRVPRGPGRGAGPGRRPGRRSPPRSARQRRCPPPCACPSGRRNPYDAAACRIMLRWPTQQPTRCAGSG